MNKIFVIILLTVWCAALYLGCISYFKKSLRFAPIHTNNESQQRLKEQSDKTRDLMRSQARLLEGRNSMLDAARSNPLNDPAYSKRLREEQAEKAKDLMERQKQLIEDRQRMMDR